MRSATTIKLATRRRRAYALSAWLVSVGLTAPAALAQQDTAPEAATETSTTSGGDSATETNDVAASEQFVTTTVGEFGRNSLQTAEAYLGLADAQRRVGEHEAAAESYLAAVEVYRAIDGPFTALAISPLTSLGDNYHEANDDLNAVSAYSEARTVSRRVYGLHNERQIELLDRMSQSMLELNQTVEAEAQQVEALRLVQRSHAPDSDEVLEGIYKYASWLGQRSLYQLERDQYARALRIIRGSYGDKDVRLVKPLLGIGNTYRNERNPAGLGLANLQDALALLLEQPQRDALAIATVLRDLGDWGVAFGKAGYDGMEYTRAWQLLGEVENGEQLRADWFSGTTYVLYEPISPRGLSQDPKAPQGHVTASFDVDTAGNSSNVTVVESDPPGLKDESVLRHIRRSRFRPMVAEGVLVPSSGLAIQFNFRYAEDATVTNDDNDKGS
jgi:tetratricopeptide (TPR) repeat protein